MRYLVTWKFAPVPPEMAKAAIALNQATAVWIEAEKKAGTIIETYATVDTNGGVAIVEHESNDALYQKIMEVPYRPFMQITVTPLSDINVAMKAGRAFLKKMTGG
jgi:muconolactone delta-isomerase